MAATIAIGWGAESERGKLHVQSHRSHVQQVCQVELENQLNINHVHASYKEEDKKAIIERVCRMGNLPTFEMVK